MFFKYLVFIYWCFSYVHITSFVVLFLMCNDNKWILILILSFNAQDRAKLVEKHTSLPSNIHESASLMFFNVKHALSLWQRKSGSGNTKYSHENTWDIFKNKKNLFCSSIGKINSHISIVMHSSLPINDPIKTGQRLPSLTFLKND